MLLQDVLYEQELALVAVNDSNSANRFLSRAEKIDNRGEVQIIVREKLARLEKQLEALKKENGKSTDTDGIRAAIEVLKNWTDKNPLQGVSNPAKFGPGRVGSTGQVQTPFGKNDPSG